MPTNTLLLEVGTEELPPKSLNNLREALQQNIEAGLNQAELSHGKVESFATPRRLGILVHDLADRQPDQNVEKRGPAVKSAFDDDGEPTKALAGFMRGCDVADPSQLDTITTNKGDYLVYRAIKSGLDLPSLLEELLGSAVTALPVDRRMRWGKSRLEFVRPVQWLVCLYGSSVIPIQLLGKEASNTSSGHRFMSGGQFEITKANDYVELCRTNYVLADFTERKNLIREQVVDLAAREKAHLEIDEDLLNEVTSLVEWPRALAGGFDSSFLNVPPEVLISAMKEHQRYFHLVDNNGKLVPRFITISNIESLDSSQVVAGNERVIRPRLADAAFFFDQDTRTSLEQKSARLENVVFQADLGTYAQKCDRIAALAAYIAQQLGSDTDAAKRAGKLCKADLVSDMVGEFPDLQGTMGSYYARHDKETEEVCIAIAQHYRPTQSGGILPTSDVASCVALADKIDSLTGIFGINQPPTGSRDPFALRRQSLGVIRICVENQLNIPLNDCLNEASRIYGRAFDTVNVSNYIVERLTSYYQEQGIPGDVVEAATNSASTSVNLLAIDDVVRTLQSFRNGPAAKSIVAANKRVANFLKKAGPSDLASSFDASVATDEAEIALGRALNKLDLSKSKGAGAKLEKLAVLQEPVDHFFDEVMVMAEDEKVRKNRLGLLQKLRQQFLEVADFSLLQ
ncbi:MAG: glycine--tRNA ligase subunit beta [Gammaproteobacteria bacterium]|nr:glycine--tRNA ligase subunit beta [Gammaproteobacteria bacterium]MBT3869263.1 glycine--tRNA ligase subunit beta [Gammaproteobacteria bacterium]MBT4377967.1 glycine--tRNA ligase subunit beta [Gammaproteobacteria bacterium]MBT5196736.1 glycine--tRNA ligase subunit beta [Gammaproteobacteria bacterium]MBT5441605.1 glycine--tRNA ligase subunit beta [Gammaproteobacteria bacterium]